MSAVSKISENTALASLTCALAGAAASVAFVGEFGSFALTAGIVLVFWMVAAADSLRSAFLRALAFHAVYLSLSLGGAYHSMNVYGGFHPALAAIATIALGTALGAVNAATISLSVFFKVGRALRLALVLPALWSLGELLRGVYLVGFGWMNTGYAFLATPFGDLAPVVGVYGIGFAVAAVCGCALALLTQKDMPTGQKATIALGMGTICVGCFFAGLPSWHTNAGNITIRMIQPDLRIVMRATLREQDNRLQRVEAMSSQSALSGAIDAVLWPEGLYLAPLQRIPRDMIAAGARVAEKTGADVVFNAFDEPAEKQYYNSIWRSEPGSKSIDSVYSKRHLVPFGEFVPFGFRWFVDEMGIPMSDQQRGSIGSEAFTFAGKPAALTICYENLFGEEIRDFWKHGANPQIIVNTANLGWFDTGTAELFTLAGIMRAKEFARPYVQCVNNSHTAYVDADGSVERIAGRGAQTMDLTVRLASGDPTPYTVYGLAFVWLAIVLSLGTALLAGARAKRGFRNKAA